MGNSVNHTVVTSDTTTDLLPLSPTKSLITLFSCTVTCELRTTFGPLFELAFGRLINTSASDPGVSRRVKVTLEEHGISVQEDHNLGSNFVEIPYAHIQELGFDHTRSEVRLFVPDEDGDSVIVVAVPDSVHLERELCSRMVARDPPGEAEGGGEGMPPIVYIGIVAGADRPKPFQRKRHSLALVPSDFSTPSRELRARALRLYEGSYRPCEPGASVRRDLALQYVMDGYNSFDLVSVQGRQAPQWTPGAQLRVRFDSLALYAVHGNRASARPGAAVVVPYSLIDHWTVVDNSHTSALESGIDVFQSNGVHWFFGVMQVWYLLHALEYCWNRHAAVSGRPSMPGSCLGRRLLRIRTLSGERKAPAPVRGVVFPVYNQDGSLAYAAGRRGSLSPTAPMETHWGRVAVHQGWLRKKVGAVNREWKRQYFVVYSTPHGHFLVYYRRCEDGPLFTSEVKHVSYLDLATVAYLRPATAKQSDSLTPPFSFDIVGADREWTLCAESADNLTVWLKILTRCVDEDVAILTDESYSYRTKSQVDPLGGVLPVNSYDLTLSLSALGAAVSVPDKGGSKQLGHWCYHDVVDWAVFRQNGKLALRFSVLEDGPGSKRLEFVVRSPDAVRIASCLEICIEKYMSFLSVRSEVDYAKKFRVNHNNDSGSHDSIVCEPTLAGSRRSAESCGIEDTSDASVWDMLWDCTQEESDCEPMRYRKLSTLPSSLRLKNASRLHEVMVSKHGTLFDDTLLQVAVTEGFGRAQEGRVCMELFYRNHGVVDINDIVCSVSGADDNFKVEMGEMRKAELAPCGVSGQSLEIICLGVGSCSLSLELSYTNAESALSRSASIRLPLSVASFVRPLRMSGEEYASRWAVITGLDREMTEVFQAPLLLNPFAILVLLEEGLGFSIVGGVPGWPDSTLCGAGQLFTVQDARDQVAGIECLIRMEVNTVLSVVRVTARSSDPRLPAAIVNADNFLCFGWYA